MITWEWLAGFTDGDGCIHIRNDRILISWGQKQSDDFVLREIEVFLQQRGVDSNSYSFSVSIKGHKYPQSELRINKQKDVRLILWNLLPYLVLKGDKAIEGLLFLDEIDQMHESHGTYIRKKNTGGWHKGGPREKERIR